MKQLIGLLSLVLTLCLAGVATPAWAGPPPFDPKQMSGIPRADPQVPSGTITVRVLGEGGFSDPQVGVDVTLELQGKDGSTKTLVSKTVEQGRATFSGLESFAGGKAVGKAQLGGKTVQTLPIDVLPSTGSRVMLVQGAPDRAAEAGAGAAGASPPHGQPAGPGVPMPGRAFPLDGQPAGSLTVGTFDLAAKTPIAGVDVTLTIEVPEGPPIVKVDKTDRGGKVMFDKLVEPAVPVGSKLVVEATLAPGGELRRSQPFSMDKTRGMAVVLAEGAQNFQPDAAAAGRPKKRPPVPGPRVLRSLPAGTVRVRLEDPNGQPVPNQAVTLVKKTAGGGVTELEGTTGNDGSATFEDVGVQQDALYFIQCVYDQGPYQSKFFGMDRRGGVSVDLRLFPTTADRSVVKSAVQYDVDELENDLGQVVQVFEVMVQGDKAFWDPNGLQIEAMPGAKGFTVLRPAEPFLDHEESAPFATLHGPIPPGELVNLSVGYLIDHEGSVRIDWAPPFEVVESSVLVGENFELKADNATESDRKPPIPDKVVYTLGKHSAGEPITFEMAGLRIRNPLFREIGLWGGVVIGLCVVFGLLLYRRGSPKDRLVNRRDELLGLLEKGMAGASREQVLAALDRIYRQLEALEQMERKPEPEPGEQA